MNGLAYKLPFGQGHRRDSYAAYFQSVHLYLVTN